MHSFVSHHQLPDNKHSAKKTLLVLASSTLARVFCLLNHDIDEYEPLSTDKIDYEYSDKEGFSFAQTRASIGTTVGLKETNKMHYDLIFVKFLVKELIALQNSSGAEEIIIYAPETLISLIRDTFPKPFQEMLSLKKGNYINESFPKLFDIIP